MSKMVVNSDRSLLLAQQRLAEEYHQYRFVRLNTKAGIHRKLDQNALSHVWYGEIARHTFQTEEEVKAECKLRFGVPILLAEDADFLELFGSGVFPTLTYEQQLQAMRFIQVTSIMTKDQMSRYLNHIQRDYAQQGIFLEAR